MTTSRMDDDERDIALRPKESGDAFDPTLDTLRVARAYHAAWTNRDFETAGQLLGEDLRTDVPLNTYPTKADFLTAVTEFGSLVDKVDLIAEYSTDDSALLLYDMHTKAFGTIRIAEQFTIAHGSITHIRHIHDTATLQVSHT